jgi:hypothetical protein
MVVFPIMNSRNEIGNEGSNSPIDGIRNEYAEINNSAVPNNSTEAGTEEQDIDNGGDGDDGGGGEEE